MDELEKKQIIQYELINDVLIKKGKWAVEERNYII
jgi:hypothetical protein